MTLIFIRIEDHISAQFPEVLIITGSELLILDEDLATDEYQEK